MLLRIPDEYIERVASSVCGADVPMIKLITRTARSVAGGERFASLFADSLDSPNVAVLLGKDWMTVWTLDDSLYRDVLICILERSGEVPQDFPKRGAWDSRPSEDTHPYVFLNQAPSALAVAAIELGFKHTGEEEAIEPAANLWYLEGNRTFGEFVRHECRVFEGQELFEVIKAGWPHGSEDGRYIKWCLDAGPSFACYDGGKIVCASSTHLSGTMGMIYTPEEYRGRGYASSLSAFQTSEMLRRDGIALAHIWHSNLPSQSLVKKLGFISHPGWFGWWRMRFPE